MISSQLLALKTHALAIQHIIDEMASNPKSNSEMRESLKNVATRSMEMNRISSKLWKENFR